MAKSQLKEHLIQVRRLIGYALGPTRDVKTPKLQEAFQLLDDAIASLDCQESPQVAPTSVSEEEIQKAAKSCTEWHGCAIGDCRHEKYSECFDAVFVEGAKWALEQNTAPNASSSHLQTRSKDDE